MSLNACLAPLCAMHGMAVTTVEGIGRTKTKLHAVQVGLHLHLAMTLAAMFISVLLPTLCCTARCVSDRDA